MAPSKAAAEAEKKRLRENVVMDEHKVDLDELCKRYYNMNIETGLTTEQARQGLEANGPNALTPPKVRPMWLKFIDEMTGFFSLLLWGGAILCFISNAIKPDPENLVLGIVLALVVFATGVFSFYQNQKSDSLMAEFAKLKPPKVNVMRDGKTDQMVPSEDITLGDICHLKTGDLVPADLRVLQIFGNCTVDNASLTGESEPQKRKTEFTHDDPLETSNLAFFGTQVPEGELIGICVKIGDETMMGRIAKLALSTDAGQTPINREIEHFIHIISAIAIILGVTFFAINLSMGTDTVSNLVFMIGIIVANVPEGLLTTVTVCLTLTAKRMYIKMVMVKNLEGVETLGSTSCICSDKTGTLTQNIMTVAQLVYGEADGQCHIHDAGSSFSQGRCTFDKGSPAFKQLVTCATLNNTAVFDKRGENASDGDPELEFSEFVTQTGSDVQLEKILWATLGNASEAAFIKLTQKLMDEMFGMKDVNEFRARHAQKFAIPFNSKFKYQVHVHQALDNAGPRTVYMKGAPERIFGRCSEVVVGDAVIPMTPELLESIDQLQSKMSCNGLRVLGFAKRDLDSATYPDGYNYNDGKDLEPPTATPNFPLGDSLLKANEFGIKAAYDEAAAAGTLTKGQNPPHENAAEGLQFLGLMALIDPPRPAVPGAVAKCKTAGIKVVMVTGDHPDTAKAIAHKVGILWGPDGPDLVEQNEKNGVKEGDAGWVNPKTAQAIVVPGWTIDVSDPESKWNSILSHPQIVFARTSPQQKLVIVSNCQRLGHIVAVTGDGVNDSPAIKQADIGIAMGIAGTPVTKNAGDMILLDDNFASIVAGVEEGRLIFDNLKKSICYTLTSNIPEISPFLCMIVFATPLPLTTILILAVDLGTDMVPAISMAYEEAEADIMRRPPRDAVLDRLVTRKLIFFAYFQIGIMQAMSGFFTWMVILNDYGFPPHILPGLDKGKQWGVRSLYCRFSGGQYVNPDGMIDTTRDPTVDPPSLDYALWDTGDSGYVIDCEFPMNNFVDEEAVGKPSGFKFKDSSTYTNVNNMKSKTAGAMMPTIEAIAALEMSGYFEYIPWKGRMSPFWHSKWLTWPTDVPETLGGQLGGASADKYFAYEVMGVYSWCLSGSAKTSPAPSPMAAVEAMAASEDFMLSNLPWCSDAGFTGKLGRKQYNKALYCDGSTLDNEDCANLVPTEGTSIVKTMLARHSPIVCNDGCWLGCNQVQSTTSPLDANVRQCANVASRMVQSEALSHGQAGYWVSIVVVQWADLLICKTRWLSIKAQGLRNSTLNFGLFFETLLAAWLCYCPLIAMGLGTRPLRFTHWMPGIPWSILIFVYDECRKYLMRATSPEFVDPATKRVKRNAGWIELNTYY